MGIFSNLFKKNKTIKLYVVSNIEMCNYDKPPLDMKIFTITSTLEESQEYYNQLLKLKHKSHFISWCHYHDENPETNIAWEHYCKTVLVNKEQDFYINIVYYDISKVAMMFRMFNGCAPLGCSFEEDVECEYFVEKLDPKVREQIEKELEAFERNKREID